MTLSKSWKMPQWTITDSNRIHAINVNLFALHVTAAILTSFIEENFTSNANVGSVSLNGQLFFFAWFKFPLRRDLFVSGWIWKMFQFIGGDDADAEVDDDGIAAAAIKMHFRWCNDAKLDASSHTRFGRRELKLVFKRKDYLGTTITSKNTFYVTNWSIYRELSYSIFFLWRAFVRNLIVSHTVCV